VEARTRTTIGVGKGLALVALLLQAGAAGAASVEARVLDTDGNPVEGAVLMAFTGAGPARDGPDIVDVDQKNKEFVPRISAVSVGTKIRFPNYDQIRHHVYSFSPAKTFEIPLYKGIPADPIVFDKPGVVTLGCNIHDWMQGWVLVTEASRFEMTDAGGSVTLDDLPAGTVRLRVWHPESKQEPEATEQSVRLSDGDPASVAFEIDRKKAWKARRGGRRGGDSYR
jgi:plastocyanin